MVIGLGFGMPLAPILLGIVTAIGGVCALLIFVIRAAAIHWDLSVPDWAIAKPKQEN